MHEGTTGHRREATGRSLSGTAEATGDGSFPRKGSGSSSPGTGVGRGRDTGTTGQHPLQVCKRGGEKAGASEEQDYHVGLHVSSPSLTPTREEVGDIWESHRDGWADRQTDGGESISVQNPLLQSN